VNTPRAIAGESGGAIYTWETGAANNIGAKILDVSGGGCPISAILSVSASDATPSGSLGMSVGLPASAALTTTYTGHFGYQDLMRLIRERFGLESSESEICL
jgi:hypothetical protein